MGNNKVDVIQVKEVNDNDGQKEEKHVSSRETVQQPTGKKNETMESMTFGPGACTVP